MLRLRSDEQLVALFRSGHDEAFRVIYDRYHKRLAGYARQMLPRGYDAEDALQDVFVRAYRALRHDDRELAIRPWLFRIAHNCCIDELRRTVPVPTDEVSTRPSQLDDPAAQLDAREALHRLIQDIQRLPEQQRSALLLRELSGISYEEVAAALETTVPAVKSLLVRARMGLVRAGEARDTACSEIREQIARAHDDGVRATPTVRRHLRDCPACRSYRGQMCVVNRRVAALLPAGPLATLARLLGLPGGSATGAGSTAPAAALSATGTASGAALGANHVAALVAAAIASTGGVVGLQHVIASSGGGAAAIHRSHLGPARGRAAPSSSAVTATLGGSGESQAGEGTTYLSQHGSASEAGLTGSSSDPGAGNSSTTNATAATLAGDQSGNSPTPTAPPRWGTTGPPPTVRPTTGDTGPTPTSTTGDGSSSSPTPTTSGTGSTTTTGDSSGTSTSTSTGSTGTTTGTSTTDTGTSSTSDTGATTAAAGDGSTGTDQSTPSSASSSGSSS